MAEQFHPFYGGPFSQWAPSRFVVDGVVYVCAEQYMMAQKARLFGDAEAHSGIMGTDNPLKMKMTYGRNVRGFDEAQWSVVSRDVVRTASLAKFTQNPALQAALVTTRGLTLVEASPTDIIWGVGLSEDDPAVHDRAQWRGTNWLGECLMDVRRAILA